MSTTTGESAWVGRVHSIGSGLAEGVEARDAADEFCQGSLQTLRNHGVTAMLVPTSLGGGGASHAETGDVLRALAYYDASAALTLSMHQHLVAAQVFAHRHRGGSPALLERVAGDRALLVSTGARDWLDSNGAALPVEGGYRVTARKAFASGAPVADVAVTSARCNDEVIHFSVDLDRDGVSVERDWLAHGMRSTGSHTLVLDDVFVSASSVSLTRRQGEFHPVWSVVLTAALPLICSVYAGIADRAAECARPWAVRRRSDAAAVWTVGEMDTTRIQTDALLAQMFRLAEDLDFAPSLERANRMLALKTGTMTGAQAAVEAAVQAAGGPAYFRRTGIERALRDVRAGAFHPLPPAAQTVFTGRVGVGLPPVVGPGAADEALPRGRRSPSDA